MKIKLIMRSFIEFNFMVSFYSFKFILKCYSSVVVNYNKSYAVFLDFISYFYILYPMFWKSVVFGL